MILQETKKKKNQMKSKKNIYKSIPLIQTTPPKDTTFPTKQRPRRFSICPIKIIKDRLKILISKDAEKIKQNPDALINQSE